MASRSMPGKTWNRMRRKQSWLSGSDGHTWSFTANSGPDCLHGRSQPLYDPCGAPMTYPQGRRENPRRFDSRRGATRTIILAIVVLLAGSAGGYVYLQHHRDEVNQI